MPLVRKISAVAQRPGLPKQRSAQPLSWPQNQPLISIGITCRKDVYPYGDVRTMEQFLESVGREHPVIVELVRSGTIVDTNYYGSYMWECRQRYSSDRWYIIGDAGDTVDPLAMSSSRWCS